MVKFSKTTHLALLVFATLAHAVATESTQTEDADSVAYASNSESLVPGETSSGPRGSGAGTVNNLDQIRGRGRALNRNSRYLKGSKDSGKGKGKGGKGKSTSSAPSTSVTPTATPSSTPSEQPSSLLCQVPDLLSPSQTLEAVTLRGLCLSLQGGYVTMNDCNSLNGYFVTLDTVPRTDVCCADGWIDDLASDPACAVPLPSSNLCPDWGAPGATNTMRVFDYEGNTRLCCDLDFDYSAVGGSVNINSIITTP